MLFFKASYRTIFSCFPCLFYFHAFLLYCLSNRYPVRHSSDAVLHFSFCSCVKSCPPSSNILLSVLKPDNIAFIYDFFTASACTDLFHFSFHDLYPAKWFFTIRTYFPVPFRKCCKSRHPASLLFLESHIRIYDSFIRFLCIP